MEPPKLNSSSDSVKRAVKQIKGLEGKKKQIDTYYEYEKLGQLLADVKAGKLDKNTIAEDEIEHLISERAEAKKSKNYARADEIRNQLKEAGILLEDSATGTTWKKI